MRSPKVFGVFVDGHGGESSVQSCEFEIGRDRDTEYIPLAILHGAETEWYTTSSDRLSFTKGDIQDLRRTS